MFHTRTILRIPKPCAESWDQMTPKAQGRHCAACQEVVVDFTQKTDAEILTFLKQYPTFSCGRFTEDQLERPLYGPQPRRPRWIGWLAGLLTIWGIEQAAAPRLHAQGFEQRANPGPQPEGDPAEPQQAPNPEAAPPAGSLEAMRAALAASPATEEASPTDVEMCRISGVVCNRWGTPLKNARIRFHGNVVTKTNTFGYFQLSLPADSLETTPTLSVSHFRHRGQYFDINVDRSRPYALFLKRRGRVSAGRFR